MGFLDFLFRKTDKEEETKKLKPLPIQPLKRLVDFLPNRQLTPVEPPTPLSSYKVQPGDSLWRITKNVNGDPTLWPKLYQENREIIGDNPNLILPKQELRLSPIQPKLSLGPRMSSLSELKKNPSPPLIKMRSAHEVPIEPIQTSSTWEKIKVGDIKGLAQEVGLGLSHGLSKTGTAKQDEEIAKILADNPIMSKFGNDQLERIQRQRDYLDSNPVNSLPAILGREIPMLPLWMTGEAAVGAIGKGITKLAPPLRPIFLQDSRNVACLRISELMPTVLMP